MKPLPPPAARIAAPTTTPVTAAGGGSTEGGTGQEGSTHSAQRPGCLALGATALAGGGYDGEEEAYGGGLVTGVPTWTGRVGGSGCTASDGLVLVASCSGWLQAVQFPGAGERQQQVVPQVRLQQSSAMGPTDSITAAFNKDSSTPCSSGSGDGQGRRPAGSTSVLYGFVAGEKGMERDAGACGGPAAAPIAAAVFPGELFSRPVAACGYVLLGCRDDYLYCLVIQGNR